MLNVTRTRRSLRDERGNLVLGMGVMMIVGMLSMALMARSVGTLGNVRRTQDFRSGLSVADGGVADAKYRVEQGAATTFIGNGTFGEGQFVYTATKIADDEWQVHSEGLVNGVAHAVEVTLWRAPEFQYALFTEQDITFNGNAPLNIYSYNSLTGDMNTGNAAIGSNHAITINGGGGGDAQHYYTPNGSCSGCSNGYQKNGPKQKDDPVAPTTYQACPATGVFGPVIDGQDGLAFLCNQNISFTAGAVTVINPPAIVYVGPNFEVHINDSQINLAGAGKDFRILKAGTGEFEVGAGTHAGSLNGVIYAPSTDITVNGGDMNVDGSLTLNSLTINGNPNFELAYDDTILDVKSADWDVKDWREVASIA